MTPLQTLPVHCGLDYWMARCWVLAHLLTPLGHLHRPGVAPPPMTSVVKAAASVELGLHICLYLL